MIRDRRWLWLLLALPPLLYLPLRAQEPAPVEAPAAERAPTEPAVADAAPEETVSADNNLSFPVDI
jgi:hypothetical protein